MPSLTGILRVAVAVLGVFACTFLLGGMFSYRRISFTEMQIKEPLKIGGSGTVVERDYGKGAGKIAFERGMSSHSKYGDLVEYYNLFYNNPDLQVCYGQYDDWKKLIPDAATGCKSQYIGPKATCDPTIPNALTRTKTEWGYDSYISDQKQNKRKLEEYGRQHNMGELGVYLATSLVSVLVGISVFWWSNDQERKSVLVFSLLLMIITVSLPYIFFAKDRDSVFVNWVECKDMTDLEYYGTVAGTTCLTNTRDKATWESENIYLSRESVEKTKLSCSSLAKDQCNNECTWVTSDVAATPESDTQQKMAALTANTCVPAIMVGRNAFPCTAQQQKFWERAGLAWNGRTRVRTSSAVRSYAEGDGAQYAYQKVKYTDYKFADEDCMKRKDTKCVTDSLAAVVGCSDTAANKPLCTISESLGQGDFFVGPRVVLTKAISGSTVFDAAGATKTQLELYGACSAEDLTFLEKRYGLGIWAKNAVPSACLSDQAGGQRSKYMDQVLARVAIGQTGIIFMILELAVISVLLLLEVLTARKEKNLNSVLPEA